MIELIYNEEDEMSVEEKELWEPKNIRQIGEPSENRKIFIEDYVHTFLQQYSSSEKNERGSIAVLLGMCERSGNKKHLFVKSALAAENISRKGGKYEFTEKIWSDIYAECGRYFPGQEIVGWFLARPGFPMEMADVIEETHRIYFSGADKVFLMMDPLEGEAEFFSFEQSFFAKQSGYCIYYERNEPMHDYMLDRNLTPEKEAETEGVERAISNFRKILQQKQERNIKRKKLAVAYGIRAGVFFLLVAGGIVIGSRSRRDFVHPELKEQEEAQETFGGEVVIEELPGEVPKQPETFEEIPLTSEDVYKEEAVIEESSEDPQPEEASTPVYEEYTVMAGDTLVGISLGKYGNDAMVGEICELNGITDVDYIQVGEIILLP